MGAHSGMGHIGRLLGACSLLLFAGVSCAQTCTIYCPDGSRPTQDCNSNNDPCASAGSSSPSGPGYDDGSARRDQEAAEQRRREEVEQERLAAERRKKEEHAKWIKDRDEAAGTLKGSSGALHSGLKGTDSYGGLKGSNTEAAAQLKSVERHGRQAQSTDGVGSKPAASQGFDSAGQSAGTLVYPDKSARRPPTTLDKQIPAGARDDPEIKQMQAWYRSLDAQKAEKQKRAAELKEQQKTSKDPVLAAKIATLDNDTKRLADDQAKATESAKKRVVNLGFVWNETPATGAAKIETK
jgi:hypothetical protein